MFSPEAWAPETKEESWGNPLQSRAEEIGRRTGNALEVIEVGEPATKGEIRPELLAGLNSEDQALIRQLQEACHTYLESPLFTDAFHTDNTSRRSWEKNLSGDPEALAWYKRNRLGTNMNDSVFGLLKVAVETIDNPELTQNLSPLLDFIPTEFSKRNQDGELYYDSLPDNEKTGVAKEVSALARQILSRIETPTEGK